MSNKTILFAAMVGALVLGLSGSVGAGVGTMTVTPSSGQPGSTFTVSGTQCFLLITKSQDVGVRANGVLVAPVPTAQVSVHVAFPTPLDANTNASVDGSWSVQFTVPAGTPPGTYQVTATCHRGTVNGVGAGAAGAPDFVYPPGTYTVLAPVAPPPTEVAPVAAAPPAPPAPPAPVAAAPTFTG